jgi:ribosomal protein L37AE/L43A
MLEKVMKKVESETRNVVICDFCDYNDYCRTYRGVGTNDYACGYSFFFKNSFKAYLKTQRF